MPVRISQNEDWNQRNPNKPNRRTIERARTNREKRKPLNLSGSAAFMSKKSLS